MALDKLLLQFLAVFAAVLLGLFVYDRMLRERPAARSPAAVIEAQESAEQALLDRAGLRGEIAAVVNQLRVAMVEFYLSHGQWPRDLKALGMVPISPGQYLTKVQLDPDGVVRLERKSGGGTLRLIPKVDGNGTVRWDCRSDWDDAALLLPGCQ